MGTHSLFLCLYVCNNGQCNSLCHFTWDSISYLFINRSGLSTENIIIRKRLDLGCLPDRDSSKSLWCFSIHRNNASFHQSLIVFDEIVICVPIQIILVYEWGLIPPMEAGSVLAYPSICINIHYVVGMIAPYIKAVPRYSSDTAFCSKSQPSSFSSPGCSMFHLSFFRENSAGISTVT